MTHRSLFRMKSTVLYFFTDKMILLFNDIRCTTPYKHRKPVQFVPNCLRTERPRPL